MKTNYDFIQEHDEFERREQIRSDREVHNGGEASKVNIKEKHLENFKRKIISEELTERFIDLLNGRISDEDFKYALFKLIKEVKEAGNWEQIILCARDVINNRLIEYGYDISGIDCRSASGAILVAESCNRMAKVFSYSFYALKPVLMYAACKLGAVMGIGEDDAIYLYDKGVGVASFHDLGGDFVSMWKHFEGKPCPTWDYPWSGVIRQNEALQLAHDYSQHGEQSQHVESMSNATAPDMRWKTYGDKLQVFEEIERVSEDLRESQMQSDFAYNEEVYAKEMAENEAELKRLSHI